MNKILKIILILLLLGFNSCHISSDVDTPKNYKVDMTKISVTEFVLALLIDERQENRVRILSTIGQTDAQWLDLADLEFLMSKIESTEKAKCVIRSISSKIEFADDLTIGDQVISIITAYRNKEKYPNQLVICKKHNSRKIAELKKWWAEKQR